MQKRLSIIGLSALLTACQFLETFEKPSGTAVRAVSPSETTGLNASPVQSLQASPSSHRVITKRINTTQCRDTDDWYLDGYRVGKSFHTQKAAMFQQRLNYCGYQSKNLPTHFQQHWEKGFKIGRQ